jgi:hypothetical protein
MGVSGVVTMLFQVMGGLGLFFTEVGVLWFVTICKEKKEKVHKLAARSGLSLVEVGNGAFEHYQPILGFDAASTQTIRPNAGHVAGLL